MNLAQGIAAYKTLSEQYGGAGLLRFDQTVDAVAHDRMRGIIGVLAAENSEQGRSVALRLNTDRASAIFPADIRIYFPDGADADQQAAWIGTILDRSAALVVVPFDRWQADLSIFHAVLQALGVNKRVSVLTDGAA